MGRRGPKPVPTPELERRGSWRAKLRKKKGEVPPPAMTELPDPPASLRRHGRAEWRRVTAELMRMGCLAQVELTALELHVCRPLDHYWECERAIKKHGLLIEGSTGTLIRNPLIIQRDRALAQHVRGCAEFGLTPADRSKRTQVSDEAGPPSAPPALKLAYT